LDFCVGCLRLVQSHLDVTLAEVGGYRMSSTGFVTFLDLTSVSCAASVPLTHKPNVLEVSVAPEPRDIRWSSANIPEKVIQRRINNTNILLALGVLLWSIPLAAIQAFATAKQLAQIPGLGWILHEQDGQLTAIINAYLPVVALLGLIVILPIIFQWIAVNYEHRKTYSEVQRSILFRYFYYQLANVYITVTAGSLWTSLAHIIESPADILNLLGVSLPTVVGYFISILMTKLLAGLPLISLRGGALCRKLITRMLFSTPRLTQRELDEVYRRETLMYGWEYPMQFLVIVICFTYACICPVILPVGALFFLSSLLVYKKQVLFVYTPQYESGGAMFPLACDCTLFGLVCGQLTLLGYVIIRHCYYEPLWLLPLPFITISTMRYFKQHYAIPSTRLSMERAMERDMVADARAAIAKKVQRTSGLGMEVMREKFDTNAYRQPVMTAASIFPMPYRRGVDDPVTEKALSHLRKRNRMPTMTQLRHPSVMNEFQGQFHSSSVGDDDSRAFSTVVSVEHTGQSNSNSPSSVVQGTNSNISEFSDAQETETDNHNGGASSREVV